MPCFWYAFDTVLPEISRGSVGELLQALTRGPLGPELRPIFVLITAAFDLLWLVFVGALVVRHTAFMIVNVTTFEVLVRPNHVQRRFPKIRGRFWFLQGCRFMSALAHCRSYWTLDTSGDTADFFGSPQDSFVKNKFQNGKPGVDHLMEEP